MEQLSNNGDSRIYLKGMRFYGFHGNRPEERTLGQQFEVNLGIETDTRISGISDNIDDTVNYSDIFKAVQKIVVVEQYHLLEKLAEVIAGKVLSSKRVDGVDVMRYKFEVQIAENELFPAGVGQKSPGRSCTREFALPGLQY